MQPIRAVLSLSLLTVSCLTLAGRQTAAPNKDAHLRGTARASIVLQYSSWDYIFMTKPSYRDGDYLRQIHRPELAGVLQQMNVPRETAVVSVGWLYDAKSLQALLGDWKRLLKECGFRKVVFVRGSNAGVEHAPIIEETDLI